MGPRIKPLTGLGEAGKDIIASPSLPTSSTYPLRLFHLYTSSSSSPLHPFSEAPSSCRMNPTMVPQHTFFIYIYILIKFFGWRKFLQAS